MKKLIGSAIAALIGAALLMGAPATLASWSGTRTSGATTIQSGSLELGDIRDITWSTAQKTPSGSTNWRVWNGSPLVPGDQITATIQVPVTLTGKNLVAELRVGTPVLTAGSGAASTALAAALTTSVVSLNGQNIAAGAAPSTTLTSTMLAQGTKSIPVVVTISFPWGTAGQYNDAVGGNVTLNMDYSLTQLDRAS